MNNIGFGIFCFGEEYYYKGTVEKINNILNGGYHCYILTENTDFFTTKPALVLGNAIAPVTRPAFNNADTPAHNALPVWLCEKTIVVAPTFVAAAAIVFTNTCASK